MLIFFPPDFHSSSLCCVPPSQAEGPCKCNGWKSQNPPPTPPQTEQPSSAVNLQEPCRSCSHTLGASAAPSTLLSLLLFFGQTAVASVNVSLHFIPGDHVTHLENVSEEEMNRLLGIVLDVEYLYTCVHKEEDADTKQVYFSLFKVSPRLPPPPSCLPAGRDALTSLSFIRSC